MLRLHRLLLVLLLTLAAKCVTVLGTRGSSWNGGCSARAPSAREDAAGATIPASATRDSAGAVMTSFHGRCGARGVLPPGSRIRSHPGGPEADGETRTA